MASPIHSFFNQIKLKNKCKIFDEFDGYKKGDKKNKAKVEETREIIKNHINWKCEAKNLFSINNQGCKYGVSNAINWFFQNENFSRSNSYLFT